MSSSKRRFLCALACASVMLPPAASLARADFSGTPITFNSNGGWCWFSDSRAIIDNGVLVIGSVAGVTGNGSTAGDIDATTYDLATHTLDESVLAAAFDRDDHANPAFVALPDGDILIQYQTHGGNNNTNWNVGTFSGGTISWGARQTGTVNITNDGNGNTYANPFYLSTPNEVVSFSRAIGYDTNYSVFTNVNSATPTFTYGGHFTYWKNPGTGALTGGNGRPYVKYASNNTDTIWFATTEDSPQNYLNSLYVGYTKFAANGSATVYTSTGTLLGGISTGTAPTTGTANSGAVTSGAGNSYLPTQFTQIAKENGIVNGFNLSSSSPYGAGYVAWASSMQLDSTGNPYLGFVTVRNLNGGYGNDLEYDYAHLTGDTWHVTRIGYAGLPLYNSQNQYAGLIAVDPLDPSKVYISADVDPVTDAALLGPDARQHWQIFEGTTPDDGTTWSWTQLTNTPSDNLRPVVTAGDGEEALVWEQGSYTSYTNWNTSMVGLIQPIAATPEPATLTMAGASVLLLMRRRSIRRR